jgi:hypothetical protein
MNNEEIINMYRMIVSAYKGMQMMDEYDLKVYVLKSIDDYRKDYIKENNLNLDFIKEEELVDKRTNKSKLQDTLIVLNKINASMELIQLVKLRLNRIIEEEKENDY